MTTLSGQRFETGISENNLKHWGELHAVKELVQNVVYAKSILNNEISIEYSNGYATLSNTPSGFTKGKLLIGESDQQDVEGAPGQYGEGMKVAMAVALRCGLDVSVQTNGFTVTPALEPSSLDPEVKALVFYIEDTELHEGTKFTISCSEEVLEEAKSHFAVLQGLDPEKTTYDNILTDFHGIYANGVKVTDTPSLYGYNFTNAELINRDRSTVDMEKLKASTRNIISTIEDEKVITEIATNIVEDDSLLESQSGIIFATSRVVEVWKKVMNKIFGGKIAMATGGTSDTQARYRKFTVLTGVPNAWRRFFQEDLQIMPSNKLRETTVDRNKHKKATPDENKNLGWAKRLVKLYYGDYGTVKVSEVVTDSYGNDCLGLHDYATDTTWLKRSILSDKEELFKTLLHETIHRVSHARDNTEQFTAQWEKACWGILTRGKGHM